LAKNFTYLWASWHTEAIVVTVRKIKSGLILAEQEAEQEPLSVEMTEQNIKRRRLPTVC